jgi:hypothetical protein
VTIHAARASPRRSPRKAQKREGDQAWPPKNTARKAHIAKPTGTASGAAKPKHASTSPSVPDALSAARASSQPLPNAPSAAPAIAPNKPPMAARNVEVSRELLVALALSGELIASLAATLQPFLQKLS